MVINEAQGLQIFSNEQGTKIKCVPTAECTSFNDAYYPTNISWWGQCRSDTEANYGTNSDKADMEPLDKPHGPIPQAHITPTLAQP